VVIARLQSWWCKPSGMLDAFMDAFADLPEPRVHENKIRYKLLDIVVMATCAVISGADDWDTIADYARGRQEWFEGFLELPNGVPSHDTFSRVFSMIDPDAFGACFLSWVSSVAKHTDGRVVPIDGKTLRRSHDAGEAALHMVSAFCTENSLVLGQLATEEKSNEITAIPKLLDMIDVENAVVTIDAMGAQRDIVDKICDKGAEYVIGLKTNQPKLFEAVEKYFEAVHLDSEKSETLDVHVVRDEGHGRDRICGTFVTSDLSGIPMKDEWTGLRSIVMVVTEQLDKNSRLTTEKRYYISALGQSAEQTAHAVRSHWEIENRLHWVLDVAYREDDSRIRRDNGAQNLAVIRHATLNILRQDTTTKLGIKNKRKKCGYDYNYLPSLLFNR
jgi:predicted transposase YbfD/YdcC